MKKLILVSALVIVSLSSFAAPTMDNVSSQDTIKKSRTSMSGIDSNSSNMNKDTMNKTTKSDKMYKSNSAMDSNRIQNEKMNQKNGKMRPINPDGVMMKNGKVMITQNGKTIPLEMEMMLENGTRVMPDGTYISKNGSTMRMRNGEFLDMSGKMIPMKKKKM